MPVLPGVKPGTSFSFVWRDRLAPGYSYRLVGKVLTNKNLIYQLKFAIFTISGVLFKSIFGFEVAGVRVVTIMSRSYNCVL